MIQIKAEEMLFRFTLLVCPNLTIIVAIFSFKQSTLYVQNNALTCIQQRDNQESTTSCPSVMILLLSTNKSEPL